MDIFGKRERQNPDWFQAGIAELGPVIEAKRTALVNYKREPSEKTLRPEVILSELLDAV